MLTHLLERFGPVTVAGTLAEGRRIFHAEPRLEAALVDIELPDGDGLDLVDEMKATRIDFPVAVLTAHADARLVNRATAAGAAYLCKPFDPEDLWAGLARLLRRVSLPVTDQVRQRGSSLGLTERESEILAYLATGHARAWTASRLGIKPSTLKSHVDSIRRKLGVPSVADAVAAVVDESE